MSWAGSEIEMTDERSYVWYVGYGSNLSEQRFLCYIVGGRPTYGQKCHKGCTDRSLPRDQKPYKIPHVLYFALPPGYRETENWGCGGVAFIDPRQMEEKNEKNYTLGRAWLITREQYGEVRRQEGPRWYGKEIILDDTGSILFYTITNENYLNNILLPSEGYIKTVMLGLKETFSLSDQKVVDYLIDKEGIRDRINRTQLNHLVETL